MRLLLFLLLAFPVTGFCQSSPVAWSLHATAVGKGNYQLRLSGTVEPGWIVCAENDPESGLTPVQLSWEQATITGDAILILSQVRDHADALFEKTLKVYAGDIQFQQTIHITGMIPATIRIKVSGFAAKGNEFIPVEQAIDVPLEGGTEVKREILAIDLDNPVADCGERQTTKGNGLWALFGKGFIGGLIALLMPCIFPMLPVTVSFFMNRASSRKQGIRNGFFYGGFIFGIYVLASVPFHVAGNVNPQLFNIIATDKWVNLAFFVVFLLFALSLFGLFELKLPGATNTDKRSNTGSVMGIFFMALTLAIVSFSCTGPILGFLLVNSISETNGAWALTAGMAGFGAALALPFGLFAVFPQWLKKLPKSGGWMETLKKSLAFVELALALKFLSNADLVEHWGILKREVFIGIWLLVTIALAFYLLDIKWLVKYGRLNITRGRLLFGTLSLLFAAYLVPGLTNTKMANLSLVSGFPPPLSYSIYGHENGKGKGVEPLVINDYANALELSRKTNKPLLIDFTGWACVNCRKMEENVWTQPEIKTLIDSKFVLVSLYVDDRKKLDDGSTMGERWAAFQSHHFGSASQPQYVLLSPDEELLNQPVGYTPAAEYKEWLECGIEAYKKKLAQR